MNPLFEIEANQPLRLWQGTVLDDWTDYNGHMTEHRYLQVFGESTDKLLGLIGVDFENARAGAFYTVETHLRHLRECRPGTALASSTEVLGYDEKRIHLFHRLIDRASEALLATGEHLCLHVAGSRACSASPDKLERIATIFLAHRGLLLPERTGAVLAKPLAQMRA